MMRYSLFRLLLPVMCGAEVAAAVAAVEHIEILDRQPVGGGAFGDAGPYQKIRGRA